MSDSVVKRRPTLDEVEVMILAAGGVLETSASNPTTLPIVHRFTPGMYIREIFMPAGSLLTSKIHKTEHPFVVSKGRLSVYSEVDGPLEVEAPYTGITKPGTRRLLFIHEDTIWTTFHATDLTDVDEIEAAIIDKRTNPLIALAFGDPVGALQEGEVSA